MKKTTFAALSSSLLAGLIVSLPTQASDYRYARHFGDAEFAVTITNITKGQAFTPILVASHRGNLDLYTQGHAASDELTSIAEGGDIAPMQTLWAANSSVSDMADSGGLLGPGESVTVTVSASNARRISLASMLIPTNDSFIALDSQVVPRNGSPATYWLPALDAGSETNSESCADIPGPVCGGTGPSDADGEGFVHVSAGISGHGDLPAMDYDWRNPVAKVTVQRISQ
jgi:hypothetical protein